MHRERTSIYQSTRVCAQVSRNRSPPPKLHRLFSSSSPVSRCWITTRFQEVYFCCSCHGRLGVLSNGQRLPFTQFAGACLHQTATIPSRAAPEHMVLSLQGGGGVGITLLWPEWRGTVWLRGPLVCML